MWYISILLILTLSSLLREVGVKRKNNTQLDPLRRKTISRQSPLMRKFSTLAGPIQKLNRKKRYTAQFKNVTGDNSFGFKLWTRIVAYGSFALVIAFGAVLFRPDHWLIVDQPDSPLYIGSLIMLICLILLQIFMIIGAYSSSRSTLKARDPIPVRPPSHLRVAFATTRAPGEPVEMVKKTLIAAKAIRYKTGTVDAWLLDETNDAELQRMCENLSVNYFTRSGVEDWNMVKEAHIFSWSKLKRQIILLLQERPLSEADTKRHDPFLAAKSKHGNFNAWRAHLASTGRHYDILAGVDTDQVPERNYLERLLGYFRDQDVAFVVGPQVYGNYAPGLNGLVARWAESQASFFQSTIQRAGNASHSAMFVGTNYAVRMNVLDQIGGFQPCITEDMATGLAIHTKRNPETGARWKSIYTPDVLAVGEGPDFWAPYFTQQWRWAAGTFDTWRRVVWRIFFKLSPKAMLHYMLMLTYYPMAALTWILGIVSSMTYLTTGATAIIVPWNQFISLFMMLVIMQLSLYFWNRRFNVSPHEPEGSYGVAGMFVSVVTAPIYLSALVGMALGKKVNFVVTTKGSNDNPDWFSTYKIHLQWATVLAAGVAYGIYSQHSHPAMVSWTLILIAICLTPFVLGMSRALPARIKLHTHKRKKNLVGKEIQHV